MEEDRFPSPYELDEDDITESIDVEHLFSGDPASSGTFRLTGIRTSSLGKLLDALPMPALVVEPSHRVFFANDSWSETCCDGQQTQGLPFESLFEEERYKEIVTRLLEQAFAERKPLKGDALLGVGPEKMWARLHLRTLRLGEQRYALVLAQDLTAERKQLYLTKKHSVELRKAHDEMEHRVQERTAQLVQANQRLKDEIAQRNRAEEALRLSEERYRSLVEDSFDGIYVIQNRTIVFANYRLSEMLGYGESEIKGLKHWTICHPDDQRIVWDIIEALEHGREMPSQHDVRLLRKDGSTFDTALNARPVRFGETSGIRVCVTDITDRKRSEELLLQTERNKAIAEMAGGVAHNFNNLLQVIMTGAQLAVKHMKEGPLNGVVPNLERILESCILGTETVKRLQEFARVRNDDRDEENEVFDLSASVEKALRMSEPWWRTNPEREGLKMTLSTDLVPECYVSGRESEIFEVVLNLVKNSVEAMPSGGRIDVRTWKDDHTAYLTVADTGVGIAPEDVNRVLQPFWTTKGVHGAGLGLASCFGIAQKRNGGISVKSNPGEGTRVTVELPLTEKREDRAVPDAARAPAQGLRALVVDDMEQAVTLLSEGLTEFGHTVFPAQSGAQALRILHENEVDIVICDLGMPEMNGWQVARSIKEMSEERGVPKIPFILLTGWGGQIDRDERIAQCGVDWVIEKPAVINKLLDALTQLTKQ